MIIFKTVANLQHWLENQRVAGKTIGFVPTMGALHKGHLSLIETSKKLNYLTVCSIFVNPTQFNDPKDFEKYPVTIDKDCGLLEQQKTDVLFLPPVKEMYPDGLIEKKLYKLGRLEEILEGAYRPGHFQGVCQVMQGLLEIVQPNELFLGQKDFQQCMVIKKLVHIMGTAVKVKVIPTLREVDGLAMSSRNMRLNETQRQIAANIYRQLTRLKENVDKKDTASLTKDATQNLLGSGFTKVDYVTIADAKTLEPIQSFDPNKKTVALVAAFINDVRLIDNMVLN